MYCFFHIFNSNFIKVLIFFHVGLDFPSMQIKALIRKLNIFEIYDRFLLSILCLNIITREPFK